MSRWEFGESRRLFHGIKALFAGQKEEDPKKYETGQPAMRSQLQSDTSSMKVLESCHCSVISYVL
jgi:hypothetical protein